MINFGVGDRVRIKGIAGTIIELDTTGDRVRVQWGSKRTWVKVARLTKVRDDANA